MNRIRLRSFFCEPKADGLAPTSASQNKTLEDVTAGSVSGIYGCELARADASITDKDIKKDIAWEMDEARNRRLQAPNECFSTKLEIYYIVGNS